MLYMVTFTINIFQMLAYIYHTWILWVCVCVYIYICNGREHVSKYGECWEIPKTEEWPSPGTEDRRLFSALNGVAGGT